MARKVLNRRELRRASDAADSRETPETGDEETTETAATTTKAKPKKKAATPAKRKSRSAAKEVRMKAFWGVFNQSFKQVAIFEYNERAAADEKAAELSGSQKQPHFVQPVKKEIEE